MDLLCADWQRFDYVVFCSLVYLRQAVLRQPFLVLSDNKMGRA